MIFLPWFFGVVFGNELHEAVLNGQTNNIRKMLLSGEFNVNECEYDNKEMTALHLACAGYHAEVVDLLLDKKWGANLMAQTATGYTPLDFAILYNNEETVAKLVAAGADIHSHTRGKMTPMHEAAYTGNVAILKLLQKKGADVNAKNAYGETPIMLAVKYGMKEAVKVLLEFDAYLFEKEITYGDTALHYAIRYGKLPIAIMLMKKNRATLIQENRQGKNPNKLAAHLGRDNINIAMKRRTCL